MSSLNKVQLIGRLGKDPEVRATQDGKTIVTMSVATSERWTDKSNGEKKEKTEWHRVVIFNDNLAKVAEKYLRKGSQVYLEGKLQTRKWTDNAGVDKYTTEVVVPQFGGSIVLLTKAEDTQGGTVPARSGPVASDPGGRTQRDIDDDIPF